VVASDIACLVCHQVKEISMPLFGLQVEGWMAAGFARPLKDLNLVLTVAVLFLFAGCTPTGKPEARPRAKAESGPPASLEILVVGDPQLAGQVARGWQAEGRAEARVREVTAADWQRDYAVDPQVDLVIFPAELQAEALARQLFLEIPSDVWNGPDINKAELLSHFRTDLARYGNKIYTAPLGAPQLVLVYRADVLAALGVAPPRTWTELDEVVAKLAAVNELKGSGDASLPRGVAQPLGADWAANVLLARVAAAVSGHGRLSTVVNVETLKPLVDSEPFLGALSAMRQWEELRAAAGKAEPYADPAAVFQALVEGEAALGITWPSALFAAAGTPASRELRVARLPAAAQWYDGSGGGWQPHGENDQPAVDYLGFAGLVVGVSRNSLHAPEAFNFLAWLGSKRTSLQLSTQSFRTGPFRSSQLANPVRWAGESLIPEAAEQYAAALRRTHEERLVMTFPKLPGQRAYLQALAAAANKAAIGTLNPAEAAAEAVAEFNRLTESLGGPQKQSRLLREAEGY
jgi:ABC-type glycerol-3-phosphate transport system substrate-binding protein